jgi:endonuclease YncB( thermonuclease family)
MVFEDKGLRVIVAAAALVLVGRLIVPVTVAGWRDPIPGPVPALVVDVIDGDTVLVRARIWLGQEVETRVRLDGVDTPELRGKCEAARRLAREARAFVQARVGGRQVILRDIQYGKYAGRVVARIQTPDGDDLSDALIAAGLGHAYDGAARAPWCVGAKAR